MNLSTKEFNILIDQLKVQHNNINFFINELNVQYKCKPKFKLETTHNLEINLIIPNAFHEKYGEAFINMLQLVYKDSEFYKHYKKEITHEYPFYEQTKFTPTKRIVTYNFSSDIYGPITNLVDSYTIVAMSLFYFLNPSMKKD